ncbi:MAG TPA: hypothetical protein VM050_08020 [Patescibacteria group bacterium]|nr:hypothetical protein [Patescibacteria group bacterium]
MIPIVKETWKKVKGRLSQLKVNVTPRATASPLISSVANVWIDSNRMRLI